MGGGCLRPTSAFVFRRRLLDLERIVSRDIRESRFVREP